MISPGEARLSPQMSPSSASSEKGLVFLLSSFPAWASPAWWWAQESRSPAPTLPWSSGPTRTTFDRPANELLLYGNDKQLDTVLYWSNLVIRAPLRAMNIGTKKLMGIALKTESYDELGKLPLSFLRRHRWLENPASCSIEAGWRTRVGLEGKFGFLRYATFFLGFSSSKDARSWFVTKGYEKSGGRGSTQNCHQIWKTFADYQYLCSSCRGSWGLKIIKRVKIFLKILKT